MKKNRIFGALSAAALLFAGACSNDVIDPNKNQGSLNSDGGSGGVFMSLDFQMPSGRYDGTRSSTDTPNDGGSTSTDGKEVGSDAENAVTNALIVIAASEAKPENRINKFGFIVAGEVQGNRIATAGTTDGNKRYRATARLQKENLNQLYQIYGDDHVPEVYVFVFCNPTADLLNLFDGTNTAFGSSDWIDATCEVLQSRDAALDKNVGVWGANSFLMNNVHLATRELPKKLLDWEQYSTVEDAFHLSNANTGCAVNVDNSSTVGRGVVLVERSVARFDFKDGSTLGDNTYSALLNYDENGDPNDAEPVVNVQIQKMCLVNMSNKFYYLPRTSANGQEANYELCGVELKWTRNPDGQYSGGNYVVGPYASKFGGPTLTTNFSEYFNFSFFEDNGSYNSDLSSSRWDVVTVNNVLSGTKDNYVKPGVEGAQPGQYRVWRYVTENLIPETQEKQVNGISTGVVFKARLKGSNKIFEDGVNYYEDYWDKGAIKNLANCLNNEPFTYTADPANPGDKDHSGLTGNSKDDPILYYIGGRLYMGWRHLRQAAIQASITVNANGELEINRSNTLYKAVFGDGPIPTYKFDGSNVENHMVYVLPNNGGTKEIDDPMWKTAQEDTNGEEYNGYLESANYAWSQWTLNGKEVGDDNADSTNLPFLKAMREAVTGAGITIYQSSKDDVDGAGYYCYYYYWNRHNDNGLNGSMGPMEFDVVRNNVYKLSVDHIARLGHPRIPENDPNSPTPETPDESDEIYLDVRVEIAPWVVRVNSIQF